MFLNKFKRINNLVKKLKKSNGRNKNGKIVIKSRGGGHKQLYRKISNLNSNHIIIGKAYNPYTSNYMILTKNLTTLDYNYLPSTNNLNPLEIINKTDVIDNIKNGDCINLKNAKPGQFLHNVQLNPNKKKVFAKSAGTFIQILKQESSTNDYIKVKLPSGEERLIHKNCTGFVGRCDNIHLNKKNLKKAGRSRWLNKRPHVRGVAMNPVDHPHGGGEGKTSGGRPSVTPQGWPAKGRPTLKNKSNFRIKLRNE